MESQGQILGPSYTACPNLPFFRACHAAGLGTIIEDLYLFIMGSLFVYFFQIGSSHSAGTGDKNKQKRNQMKSGTSKPWNIIPPLEGMSRLNFDAITLSHMGQSCVSTYIRYLNNHIIKLGNRMAVESSCRGDAYRFGGLEMTKFWRWKGVMGA